MHTYYAEYRDVNEARESEAEAEAWDLEAEAEAWGLNLKPREAEIFQFWHRDRGQAFGPSTPIFSLKRQNLKLLCNVHLFNCIDDIIIV